MVKSTSIMRLNTSRILAALSLLSALTSCVKEQEDIFKIENRSISVDCTEQTVEQIIKVTGEYSVDASAVDWISADPETGQSDGQGYAVIRLRVSYNKGTERKGSINVRHNSSSYPIEITQGKCTFTYGEPKLKGLIAVNKPVEATVVVPYSGASGQEEIRLSAEFSGEGAQGLSVPERSVSGFQKGEGELVIPIEGMAVKTGAIQIDVVIDAVSIGKVSGRVSDGTSVEGFPVGWNFYSLGLNPMGTEYDFSWTPSAKNPAATPNPADHKVLPSYGNEEARLSATSSTITAISGFTFNPGIQIQGMKENDYWLITIPVMNVMSTQAVSVEASVGAAGSAAGYFMLEYSGDGKTWTTAPGSVNQGEADVLCHYYVTPGNASVAGYPNTRKTYDKATDDGYRKYIFALEGLIEPIYEGNLYFRLRVCADARAVGATNIAATKWCDLKGFEVALVEGDPDADFVKIETSSLSVDCMEQTAGVTMSSKGGWTIESEADWLTTDITSGAGTGEGFTKFNINVAYNQGEARTGVINVIQGEKRYPVTVTQGECSFAFGTPAFSGKLFRGEESTAEITVPYVYASGRESVRIRTVVSGEAAEGLEFPETTVSSFVKGEGKIVVGIAGTPVRTGAVDFTVYIDGKEIGTLSQTVEKKVDPNALQGLKLGWNFYALGYDSSAKKVNGSEYDLSWSTAATSPASEPLPYGKHVVLPSYNEDATEAYLTAQSSSSYIALSDYTFNPGIQIKGMLENDAWVMVLPVKNFTKGQIVEVESCVAGAGSGPAHFMLEYSSDGTTWFEAPGAAEQTAYNSKTPVRCHYYVTPGNASVSGYDNTRKLYDKATDTGYAKYTFALDRIESFKEGTVYFRLRICANVRVAGGTAIGDAWNDLKGFEVNAVTEE